MAILSQDIVGLILGGGRFGTTEINLTSSVLFFYALTVPLESLWYLYARAYYALKDTWTPFWFRLAGTVINLLISYFLSPVMGAAAFSLGLLCAFSLQMAMFTIGLKMKVKEYNLKSVMIVSLKLFLCALIMAGAVYGFREWAYASDFISAYSARMQYLFVVVAGIVLGFALYVILTIIFRCADFSVIRRVSGRILK
jgi:putative peptidoglycan lipid II flippase